MHRDAKRRMRLPVLLCFFGMCINVGYSSAFIHKILNKIKVQIKMRHDDHFVEFKFKFSQCHLLDETTTPTTSLDMSTTHRRKTKKNKEVQEEEPTRPMNVLEQNVSLYSKFFT